MGLAEPQIDPTAPAAPAATEFAFGAADFERVRTLIHQRAGISLNPGKHRRAYCKLSRRQPELPRSHAGAKTSRI